MSTTAVSSDLPPVQLLGLGTNLDVNSIVTQLESIQQQPLTVLQNQVSSYQTEVSAYGQLGSALSAFQLSLASLENGSAFQSQTANVADSTVASATLTNPSGAGAANGTYSLAVSQLAQTQITDSSDFAGSTAAVGTGTITIQLGSWNAGNTAFTPSSSSPKTITINSNNDTVQGIASAINAANAGVSASIVNDGSGARLVLTSTATGANNGFEVSVNDSDGNNTDAQGLSALAYNPTVAGGTPQTTLLQSAQNANLTLDGIAISSASNTVSNALSGVSLSLTGTSTSPTTLSVSTSTANASTAVQSLVTAYNSLQSSVAALTQNTPGGTSNGPLAADPSTGLILSQLQNIMASVFNTGDSSIQSLNDLGISFNEDGTLSLNQSTLNSALAQNPNAVQALFSNNATSSNTQVQYTSATSATQPGTYALNITQAASHGQTSGSSAAGLTVTQGVNDSLNLVIDGVSATVTIPAGTYSSASALATAVQGAINAAPAFQSANVSATVSQTNGVFTIAAGDYGSLSTVVVNPTAGSQNLLGTSPTAVAGTSVQGTLGGFAFTGSGQTITGAANTPTAGLVLSYAGSGTGAQGSISYTNGIAAQLDSAITQFMDPTNGVIATATNELNTEITNVQQQESDLQANISTEQATLISEFTAMTQLVDSLNQTSNFLSQTFGQSSSVNLGGSSSSTSTGSSQSSSGSSGGA